MAILVSGRVSHSVVDLANQPPELSHVVLGSRKHLVRSLVASILLHELPNVQLLVLELLAQLGSVLLRSTRLKDIISKMLTFPCGNMSVRSSAF